MQQASVSNLNALSALATSHECIQKCKHKKKENPSCLVFRSDDKNNPLQHCDCLFLVFVSDILRFLAPFYLRSHPKSCCRFQQFLYEILLPWNINNAWQEEVVAFTVRLLYFIINWESLFMCVCVLWDRGQRTHVIMLDWDSRHQRATERERQKATWAIVLLACCTPENTVHDPIKVFGTVSPVRSLWPVVFRKKQKVLSV